MAEYAILIGMVVVGVLVGVVSWRSRAFERLGARLAGDRRRDELAAARAASPECLARVAELTSLLAASEELRFIRWTPARAASGARFVLGASPAAWYLWLPDPEVLVRVPDTLVASVEQRPEPGAVVRLVCRSRDADAVVTATDGTVIEEAESSASLAAALLDGLLIVDPQARRSTNASPSEVATDAATVAFGLAS